MRGVFINALKLIVSVFCVALLIRSIDWKTFAGIFKNMRPGWVILALSVFWFAQVISALRCAYIARHLGKTLNLTESLRAHFIGLWFNQVLPTSLGGDVVKVTMLTKSVGLSVSVRAVILDRLSGLTFLMTMLVLTLPWYPGFLHNRLLTATLGVTSIGFMLAVACAVAWSAPIIDRLQRYPWLKAPCQLLADIATLSRQHALWQQTWTSAIVHFNGIATYALLGFALGIPVNPFQFILIVPLVFLIALMPLSLAGWGVREMGAIWLFGLAGVDNEPALAISISFGFLLIMAGLPGLILFLVISQRPTQLP